MHNSGLILCSPAGLSRFFVRVVFPAPPLDRLCLAARKTKASPFFASSDAAIVDIDEAIAGLAALVAHRLLRALIDAVISPSMMVYLASTFLRHATNACSGVSHVTHSMNASEMSGLSYRKAARHLRLL